MQGKHCIAAFILFSVKISEHYIQRNVLGFSQIYICLVVSYKIICLQFSYAFFCLSFFLCIRNSALSQSFITFQNSRLRECILQNFLQLAKSVIVPISDERVEQAGTLHSVSSKDSDKPVL